VIYVPAEKSKRIERILSAAIQGIHLFFAPDELRESLQDPAPLSDEQAYQLEPLLEQVLIHSDDPASTQAMLDSLPAAQRRALIRTYFAILENHLYTGDVVRH
jgi:hypothetical protein